MTPSPPPLSEPSLTMLLDLVEARLDRMQVRDHHDARALAALETCRRELLALGAPGRTADPGSPKVVSLAGRRPRRSGPAAATR